MPEVGTVEYELVVTQAAGKAVCPWCNLWHSRATGAPVSGGEWCEGRYARVRKAAVVVRGKTSARGGGFRVPSGAEINIALADAS